MSEEHVQTKPSMEAVWRASLTAELAAEVGLERVKGSGWTGEVAMRAQMAALESLVAAKAVVRELYDLASGAKERGQPW